MYRIIGSIVIYDPNWPALKETISSFLNSNPTSQVMIWDNSTDEKIQNILLSEFPERVSYTRSSHNIGFGAGHNQNFKKCNSDYFCLLNPDIKFDPLAIDKLIEFSLANPEIGLMSCAILNNDESPQWGHRYLPNFEHYAAIILKKILRHRCPLKPLPSYDQKKSTLYLPVISGCFMLFKSDHYRELKGFDERFFLYFEDYDISLRSFLMGKSVILNQVSITHAWTRASHNNFRLFLIHALSGFKFYLKWGFTSKFPNSVNQIAREKNSSV